MDLSDVDLASLRRLTRDEFGRIQRLGLFDDQRVELLHGLVFRMTKGAPHEWVVHRLIKKLTIEVGDRAEVRCAASLAVSDDSEPEPDIMIVANGDYTREIPSTALLVIEVSDTTLRKDRKIKSPLYSFASVAEYWIVNLNDRCIEVYEEPKNGDWSRMRRVDEGERLSPPSFPDIVVEVSAILPPRD